MALALTSVTLIALRVRAIFFHGAAHDRRYGEAVLASLDAGEIERVRSLGRAGGWAAQITRAALDAQREGVDVGLALDEASADIRFEAGKGVRGIRVAASLGSASGLLGACWEFLWLTGGDHGLAGMVAGLPLKIATERALLAVCMGFGVTILCLGARTQLVREATLQLARIRKLAEGLESRLRANPQ